METKTSKRSGMTDEQRAMAQLKAVKDMLEGRIPVMGGALKEAEFAEHLKTGRYLDEGTAERAYWHAGYVAAMQATLRMIQEGVTEWPMKDDETGRAT